MAAHNASADDDAGVFSDGNTDSIVGHERRFVLLLDQNFDPGEHRVRQIVELLDVEQQLQGIAPRTRRLNHERPIWRRNHHNHNRIVSIQASQK